MSARADELPSIASDSVRGRQGSIPSSCSTTTAATVPATTNCRTIRVSFTRVATADISTVVASEIISIASSNVTELDACKHQDGTATTPQAPLAAAQFIGEPADVDPIDVDTAAVSFNCA